VVVLVLAHDAFFGDLQFTRETDGITLSHRIANSPPAEVPTHTHSDAHFVLVTSGHYVSSARGDAKRRGILIYNPPGTKHRDHFWEGTGSFFTISLSAAKLAQSISNARPVAVHLTAIMPRFEQSPRRIASITIISNESCSDATEIVGTFGPLRT
jgi:hypothetical protein